MRDLTRGMNPWFTTAKRTLKLPRHRVGQFENQSITLHSKIENALQDIRKTWVDSPRSSVIVAVFLGSTQS